MGYKLAGYQPRLAVEWDKHAADCYRLNFPATPFYHGDVAALSGEQALEMAGLTRGELDVLDGSPPCQGFSMAGSRQLADGRNHLFLEYVRLLKAFNPRAFVMENVPGIAVGKMKLVFLDVMRALEDAGYHVKCAVLNAADYGVPQLRRRAIFIGVRNDNSRTPTFPAPTVTRHVTVGEVLRIREFWVLFGDAAGSRFSVDTPSHVIMKSGLGTPNGQPVWPKGVAVVKLPGDYPLASVIPAPPLNGKALAIATLMREGGAGSDVTKGKWFSCKRLKNRAPSRTITKGAGLFNKYPNIVHPTEVRGLSVGEVQRLQSFPDDYLWPEGTKWVQGWARVGNSVPPLMMAAIARHIRATLL